MTDSSTFFAVVGAVWVAIGLFLSLVMGRRGYNALIWLVLGALLGPLAVLLAVVSRRRDEAPPARAPSEPVVAEDTAPSGPVVAEDTAPSEPVVAEDTAPSEPVVPALPPPVPDGPAEPDRKAQRRGEKAQRQYEKMKRREEKTAAKAKAKADKANDEKPSRQAKEPKGRMEPVSAARPAQEAGPAGAGAPTVADGGVEVLIGYDGSAEAQGAPEAARELLGRRLTRLTVATVVPYDCSRDVERLAKSELRRITVGFDNVKTNTELLHGRPAVVLSEYAAAGGYDLVVVGARGAGGSKSVLGSTAKELARRTKVPVLLVGASSSEHDEPVRNDTARPGRVPRSDRAARARVPRSDRAARARVPRSDRAARARCPPGRSGSGPPL